MSLRSMVLVIVQVLAILFIVLTGPFLPRQPILAALVILGLLLIVSGILALRVHNWNVGPEARKGATLVRNGPYRYVRHPIYAGGLLVTLAWVIAAFTWVRLLLWMVLVVDLVVKVRWEETLLTQAFADYPEYMRQTKRLIPFIY